MRTFFVKLAALVALAPAAALASPAEQETTAVWKTQALNFEYRGYNTVYSCQTLEDKLEVILRTVGARENVRLQSYVCDEGIGIARFQIAMQSPVLASEANIREIVSHDSKDELVARVNGTQLPGAADLERFPAVWKEVSFSRNRSMRLERGDCELVQQLRQQILPRMSVRIVKDRTNSCSSAFGNVGSPRLVVSALVPARPTMDR